MVNSLSDERVLYATTDTANPEKYNLEVVSAGVDILIAAGSDASIEYLDFVMLERSKVIALRDALTTWIEDN